MRYFSMFSGIGGFELGIKKAMDDLFQSKECKHEKKGCSCKRERGLDNKSTARLGCVGYSEIDKYAIQIYQKHFPEHKNYGDATNIDASKLPDFDMLCGGFPCQAFSVAGKRLGFKDTRGTLFFDIARIIKEKKPRIVFLENVKGLLNHDKGRTFTTILATFDELGYNVEWQVLNSKHFGVPQNRERVFIIGHLRGSSSRQIFPLTGNNTEIISEGLVKVSAVTGITHCEVSPTLDTMYKKGLGSKQARPGVIQYIKKDKCQSNRIYSVDGIAPTIPSRGDKTGSNSPIIGKSFTKIRRLTPIECERLQGFPDGWTEGLSDTQRYKCLGNAVTVNVIEAIAEQFAFCGN